MNVLLLRPDPGNERFGLGPFFRVEPLGLGYLAAALESRGHRVRVHDMRFRGRLAGILRRTRPRVVGLSCMHALEYDETLALAREVRRLHAAAFLVIGGHSAAAHPRALQQSCVDAICLDDGEIALPALVEAIEAGRPPESVPGLLLPRDGSWLDTGRREPAYELDEVPLPSRSVLDHHRQGYHCLLFKPVWLIETSRGCPFRCNFCSVWQLHDRTHRLRGTGHVADDFERTGEHVFIVDDLFWHQPARSLELAEELRRRGVKKRWILVQTRTDLVARHPELLEAWRPLAQDFDIFFGLEAATDDELSRVSKDSEAAASVEAAAIARELRYGVTGNFLVDPDWEQEDFEKLWAFVEEHDFQRAGYTILTPLPGTRLWSELEERLRGQPWTKYDMHHLLWEPRLGAERFFELYAETWRRSILNLSGRKSWLDWLRQVRPSQVAYITRVMLRTQRLMKAGAYLAEHARA